MAPSTAPEPSLPRSQDIKLIVTDVDGTFLTDTHQLHPRTRSAVLYIRKHFPDVKIAIATGKQRAACEWFIKELGFDDSPAAACHGAVLHGPFGKVVKTAGIGNDIALRIYEEASTLNKSCFMFTAEQVVLVTRERGSPVDWAGMSSKYDVGVVDGTNDGFIDRVKSGEETVIKTTIPLDVTQAQAVHERLRAVLPSSIQITRALPFILEVLPTAVNKAVALRHFCETLGCSPENVVAFGDGENDVELLKAVGYGVAMANAMEAPAKVAKYHTLSNNEGGVGVWLDRVFRPEVTK